MTIDYTQDSALTKLARETNTPSEKVAEVYTKEVAELEVDAKVKTFIPALALRRARQRLHKGRHT